MLALSTLVTILGEVWAKPQTCEGNIEAASIMRQCKPLQARKVARGFQGIHVGAVTTPAVAPASQSLEILKLDFREASHHKHQILQARVCPR